MSDAHALSGAYAIDALDALERARFERHLVDCAVCQTEVDSLREAAGLLAAITSTEPPPALRDRVLGDIKSVRPLPPLSAQRDSEAPSAVAGPSPWIRQVGQLQRRWVPRLTAAAVLIAAIGAGAAVWQPWSDDQTQQANQVTTTERVLQAPDATRRTQALPGGGSATLVHARSVGRAILIASNMPAAPDTKVYQLWLRDPAHGILTAGLMPAKRDQTVILAGDARTAEWAGITIEPAGGSISPSTAPIVEFELGRT